MFGWSSWIESVVSVTRWQLHKLVYRSVRNMPSWAKWNWNTQDHSRCKSHVHYTYRPQPPVQKQKQTHSNSKTLFWQNCLRTNICLRQSGFSTTLCVFFCSIRTKSNPSGPNHFAEYGFSFHGLVQQLIGVTFSCKKIYRWCNFLLRADCKRGRDNWFLKPSRPWQLYQGK